MFKIYLLSCICYVRSMLLRKQPNWTLDLTAPDTPLYNAHFIGSRIKILGNVSDVWATACMCEPLVSTKKGYYVSPWKQRILLSMFDPSLKRWVSFIQHKSDKAISCKIHAKLERIILKYNDIGIYLFPLVKSEPNSKTNRIRFNYVYGYKVREKV